MSYTVPDTGVVTAYACPARATSWFGSTGEMSTGTPAIVLVTEAELWTVCPVASSSSATTLISPAGGRM